MDIALINDTWIDGEPDAAPANEPHFELGAGSGIFLSNACHSRVSPVQRASQYPKASRAIVAKRVFVPYTSVLFIVVER